MEKAQDNISLDEPVLAGADGSTDAAQAQPAKTAAAEEPAEESRSELHASFNDRISYLCKMVALVIAVVALATIVLGHDDLRFVLMGLCLSVALLAIAALQDYNQRKR